VPSEIDWARLAAYIDGEGCISIHRRKQYSHKAKPGWRPNYLVQVSIGNTDARLIKWLHATFGGFVGTYPDPKNRNWCFRWTAHSGKCSDLLKQCLPYFIMKREQAEIAIEFRSTYSKEYVGRGRIVPDEVIAKRDGLLGRLREVRDEAVTLVN
jgi:hypothetical protein